MHLIRGSSVAAVVVVVVTGALLAGCSGAGSPAARDGASTGFVAGAGTVVTVPIAKRASAPALNGNRLGGGRIALADYRGRVVVLNVWGSWCAPCRKETPALVAAAKELAPNNVAFLGLNTKDNAAAASAFQTAFGVTYPSYYDPDGNLLLQLRDSVPPRAIPSTLVLDPQGRVAAAVIGGVTQKSLSDIVGKVVLEAVRATASPRPSVTP